MEILGANEQQENTTITYVDGTTSVDVSVNEYVTKFAYNRNIFKLVENDIYLNTLLTSGSVAIETYNKNKVYSKNDYVFFKISPSSTDYYLLKYVYDLQSDHKPLVKVNSLGQKVVVNGQYWHIVGIPEDEGNISPKTQALEYIGKSKNKFIDDHEQNTGNDAHPTGKLGINESSKLFTNLTNIKEDRSNFFYPYHLEKMPTSDTITHGFYRKWDNGLIEYDIVFRLGYCGVSQDGRDYLSANSLHLQFRNDNYLYFKDDKDLDIFNKTSEEYVTTTTSKQVNLVPGTNAFHGQIDFPEQFKDTNYMIFTTNIKNTDTEAKSIKNLPKFEYDERLKIAGNTIIGYVEGSSFRYPVTIPDEIRSIDKYALTDIEQTNAYPVVFQFSKSSKLNMIDSYAFNNSKMTSIDIMPSVRYIGEYAFGNCNQLTAVNFYVKNDARLQVNIEQNAFSDAAVKVINIYYNTTFGASISEEQRDKLYSNYIDIFDKLNDPQLRIIYGLVGDIQINTYGKSSMSFSATHVLASSQCQSSNQENMSSGYENTTIDINALLGDIGHIKTPMFATVNQNESIELTDIFYLNDEHTAITGYDYDYISQHRQLDIDLSELENVTAISSNALCAFASNSLNIPANYTIATSAFTWTSFDKLYIDMSNSLLENESMSIANIQQLKLDNIKDGRQYTINSSITLSGLLFDCFKNASIYEIEAREIDSYSQISDFFVNKNYGSRNLSGNCLSISLGTTIKTTSDSATVIKDENNDFSIQRYPNYLSVYNNEVVSCFFDKLSTSYHIAVSIPYGCTSINDNVFDVSGNDLLSSVIFGMYIPNTIKKIGKHTFKGNKALNKVMFDENSQIETIGEDAFYGCEQLFDLKFKTENT